MRIHTSLTKYDVQQAARIHGVTLNRLEAHTSRKRDHAYEVQLHGTSSRRTMSNDGNAATWDEWGVFMSRILVGDPDALLGKEDSAAFHYRTSGRFDNEIVPVPGHNHRWEYAGGIHQCKTCDAELRNN